MFWGFFWGLGRKKRSHGVADFADQINKAVDLRDIGNHIDTAIDAVGDFGSDAINEIKDFANSDGVRRVGNKVVDVANDVGESPTETPLLLWICHRGFFRGSW